MNGWFWYGTSKLQVIPYMPGTVVYRDGMLPFLYTKLKEEGKVSATFCGDNKTMDEFVAYFNRIKVMQVLCRVTSDNLYLPVGLSWVDNCRGVDGARVAMCGEAFFDGASRTRDARDLARLALAYAFEDLRIDVLHGVQVSSNFAARNFSAKLGFKKVAEVPNYHFICGELVDATVMMLKKTDFWPGFMDWRANQESTIKPQIPVDSDPVMA
jgi:hypothetical protein